MNPNPSTQEVERAERILQDSCAGLEHSPDLPAWLAEQVRLYHWWRSIHPSATEEKAALARHIAALRRAKSAAVELEKATADLGKLPLRIRQALLLREAEARGQHQGLYMEALELRVRVDAALVVAQVLARDVEPARSPAGRQPDLGRDAILLHLINDMRNHGAHASAARLAAAAVLIAYDFPDVPKGAREIRRVEKRTEKRLDSQGGNNA